MSQGIPESIQQLVRKQSNAGTASTPIPNVQTAPMAPQKSIDLTAAEASIRVQGQFGKSLAAAEEDKAKVRTGNEAASVGDTAEQAANEVLKPVEGSSSPEWDKAIQHTAGVVEEAMKKAGQPDCNPFLWKKHNIDPLIETYRNGDRSKELLNKFLALKCPNQPTHVMKAFTTFS